MSRTIFTASIWDNFSKHHFLHNILHFISSFFNIFFSFHLQQFLHFLFSSSFSCFRFSLFRKGEFGLVWLLVDIVFFSGVYGLHFSFGFLVWFGDLVWLGIEFTGFAGFKGGRTGFGGSLVICLTGVQMRWGHVFLLPGNWR